MRTEELITDFNRVNEILIDLTIKEMTLDWYSFLIDFNKEYSIWNFSSFIEEDLKCDMEQLVIFYRIVSVISHRPCSDVYKQRINKFKDELERNIDSANDAYNHELKRYSEFNRTFDSVQRTHDDPMWEVFMKYRHDYEEAREQKRKAEDYLKKCDTAISNIFSLCEKIEQLLMPYCLKEDFSETNIIHTEHKYNQQIDNHVANNSNNNASENSVTNTPADVSAHNTNKNRTYIPIDFVKRLYPLICNYEANYLKKKEISLEPSNILKCKDCDELYNLLNLHLHITEDYKKYINASKKIILAFIYVIGNSIAKDREEWTELIYCKFYDSEELKKIQEGIRKHRDTDYQKKLEAALKKS